MPDRQPAHNCCGGAEQPCGCVIVGRTHNGCLRVGTWEEGVFTRLDSACVHALGGSGGGGAAGGDRIRRGRVATDRLCVNTAPHMSGAPGAHKRPSRLRDRRRLRTHAPGVLRGNCARSRYLPVVDCGDDCFSVVAQGEAPRAAHSLRGREGAS